MRVLVVILGVLVAGCAAPPTEIPVTPTRPPDYQSPGFAEAKAALRGESDVSQREADRISARISGYASDTRKLCLERTSGGPGSFCYGGWTVEQADRLVSLESGLDPIGLSLDKGANADRDAIIEECKRRSADGALIDANLAVLCIKATFDDINRSYRRKERLKRERGE